MAWKSNHNMPRCIFYFNNWLVVKSKNWNLTEVLQTTSSGGGEKQAIECDSRLYSQYDHRLGILEHMEIHAISGMLWLGSLVTADERVYLISL